MPRIVLVHGIGHEHRSAQQAEALEATWRGHLAEGLRRGGYDGFAQELCRDERTPSGITVRLAFYGDCFRRPGRWASSRIGSMRLNSSWPNISHASGLPKAPSAPPTLVIGSLP